MSMLARDVPPQRPAAAEAAPAPARAASDARRPWPVPTNWTRGAGLTEVRFPLDHRAVRATALTAELWVSPYAGLPLALNKMSRMVLSPELVDMSLDRERSVVVLRVAGARADRIGQAASREAALRQQTDPGYILCTTNTARDAAHALFVPGPIELVSERLEPGALERVEQWWRWVLGTPQPADFGPAALHARPLWAQSWAATLGREARRSVVYDVAAHTRRLQLLAHLLQGSADQVWVFGPGGYLLCLLAEHEALLGRADPQPETRVPVQLVATPAVHSAAQLGDMAARLAREHPALLLLEPLLEDAALGRWQTVVNDQARAMADKLAPGAAPALVAAAARLAELDMFAPLLGYLDDPDPTHQALRVRFTKRRYFDLLAAHLASLTAADPPRSLDDAWRSYRAESDAQVAAALAVL